MSYSSNQNNPRSYEPPVLRTTVSTSAETPSVAKHVFANMPDLGQSHIRILARFIALGNLMVAVNGLVWGAVWIVLGSWPMAVISFSFIVYAAMTQNVSMRGEYYKALSLMTCGIVFWLFVVAIVASGPGLANSGSVHAFFLTLAVCLYIVLGKVKPGIRLGVTFTMLVCFLGVHLSNFTPILSVPEKQHIMAGYFTWTSAFICTCLFVFFSRAEFSYDRKITFVDRRLKDVFIATHKNKHDSYLQTQAKQRMVAKAIPECSMLYVSTSSVSELIKTQTELQVLADLNNLYGDFDNAVYDMGLDKIDTVKSAYFVSSGVTRYNKHNDGSHHANQLLKLAIRFLTIAARYPHIDVSLGIHSGAATAGLTNDHTLVYSLWGENVDLAYRLHRLGQKNVVNMSYQTYQYVGQHHLCKHTRDVVSADQSIVGLYELCN
ncbi:MAG: adenylate/guanylate cyclase domain-containing protein [Glaciecola sp.]